MMVEFVVIRWVCGAIWLVSASENGYMPHRQFVGPRQDIHADHFWKRLLPKSNWEDS